MLKFLPARLAAAALLLVGFSIIPFQAQAETQAEAQAAYAFNDPAFARTWQRVDLPVLVLPGVGRGYTWGPPLAPGTTSEPYNGGSRTVQYFDKARMEINNPTGDPASLYYVTTGLLVKELVTGWRQDGDSSFTPLLPADVQVAGDSNQNGANPLAPSYASFKAVVSFGDGQDQTGFPSVPGGLITRRIDKNGLVSEFSPPENLKLLGYDEVTRHNIADVFVRFGQDQNGLVWDGQRYVAGDIFYGNATYILGRPITEPYWTRAEVRGQEQAVLVQLFERRVLTYTPGNPAPYRVEMGNVGQHYFRWRYGQTNIVGGGPVTLANDGQTLSLHSGETFLLKLGEGVDWTVDIDDPAVVSRVPNITVIRGAQGVYLAHQPGQANLTAVGEAACRKTQPACLVPTRIFRLVILVQ